MVDRISQPPSSLIYLATCHQPEECAGAGLSGHGAVGDRRAEGRHASRSRDAPVFEPDDAGELGQALDLAQAKRDRRSPPVPWPLRPAPAQAAVARRGSCGRPAARRRPADLSGDFATNLKPAMERASADAGPLATGARRTDTRAAAATRPCLSRMMQASWAKRLIWRRRSVTDGRRRSRGR